MGTRPLTDGPPGPQVGPFSVSHDTSIILLGWTNFYRQFLRGGQIDVFGSAQDPPGPKKGQKGPFGATHMKNRIEGLKATEILLVPPIGVFRIRA